DGMVHRPPARSDGGRRLHANARRHGSTAVLGGRTAETAEDPAAAARRVGVPLAAWHPRALARPPRPAIQPEDRRRRVRRAVRARGVVERTVRWQLQLARPHLVPGELPADRVAAEVPSLSGRRVHGGIPDWLWPATHARTSGDGALAAALLHLPPRWRRSPAGVRQGREDAARSSLPRLPALPRVLQRRRRLGRRRESPDGLDRPGGEAAPAERRVKCA